MPVIIVSGSGNQGRATSLPVIEYAREFAVGHEKLIPALVLATSLPFT
jgi:L-cysteine desulfidase